MDERLTNIENQKQQALKQSDTMYNNLLNDNQNLYNQQQDYANKFEQTQNETLDKQLAYNTNLIEQQKENARENARVEQNKAKNDYYSVINPYGAQAESIASRGLSNSGVDGTFRLGAHNIYQNRVATANKTMQDAIRSFDNDLNAAKLQHDSSIAQNALKKLELQLGFAESFYNKKGELTQNQFNSNQNIGKDYFNRYQTEYENIQNEKARAEAIRQWEAQMAYQKERDRIADQQWEKEYALSKAAAARKSSSGGYNLSNGSSAQLSNGGYQIISTDDNGWGKTNLTQKLSNGGTAEVFRNPQGELLYWNPSINGWDSYGQETKKNNGNSGLLVSTYTPTLSSNNATIWMSKNFSPKMSDSDIARMIANGEKNGILKPGDKERILKSYGL